MKNFIIKFKNRKIHKDTPPILIEEDGLIIIRIIHKKGHPSYIYAIKENDTIHLNDIHTEHRNKGYGSAMMDTLIQYAKDNDCKEIIGFIASTDMGHFELLKHFYEKYGFKISRSNDPEDRIKVYDLKLLL